MHSATHRLLQRSRFRASPLFELVVFNRLSEDVQRDFAELSRDADFYGILRPREGNTHTLRSVSCDAALLLLTLGTGSELPHFAQRDDESLEGVLDLVIGGLIEIEHDGVFLPAESATQLLAEPSRDMALHPLTRLSHDAIRFVASASSLGGSELTAALYQANRQPSTPQWERLITDRESVLRYIGLPTASSARHSAATQWEIDRHADTTPAWIYFIRRNSSGANVGQHDASYKLYVSPAFADLPYVFTTVLDVATRAQVKHMKLGSDLSGLLRPDKLVLYFADLTTLTSVADSIARRCTSARAHGVPFTAPIDDAGLLSWGADPPDSAQLLSWQPRDSWRSWLAQRLASALAECRNNDREVNMAYALERLHRDGVDADRWVPTSTLWAAA